MEKSLEKERLKIEKKLDFLFKGIKLIKNWKFGYFKIVRKNQYVNYDIEAYFEIKLEMSSSDYISYNIMNKLLDEKSLKEQIRDCLLYTKKKGQNWQFDLSSYYFKIKLCDKIGEK